MAITGCKITLMVEAYIGANYLKIILQIKLSYRILII